MVDTRKLKTFIKLSDLTKHDVLKFTDEGSIQEKDFSKQQDGSNMKAVLIVKASLNGESPKEITLNNTTINILKKKWGGDTADWVGKSAGVAVVETLSYGELKEVNVLKPLEEEEPVAAPVRQAPTSRPAPAKVNPNYCQCGENAEAIKKEEDGKTFDFCVICDKPMMAWDE